MKDEPNNVLRSVILHHAHTDENKALLNAILEWLSSDSTDGNEWDAYIDFAEVCLENMLTALEATPDLIIQTRSRQHQSIRHVRAMISAMKNRDWAEALEGGQAAMRMM